MRILSCSLENFGSYARLDCAFTNQGLTLIQGATGSGKSTICDTIPWILFGITAKGGAVNEVLRWPGTGITKGIVYLEGGLEIVRIRGSKAKDNDLYFAQENETGTVSTERGKDLNDTQRLINNLLGFNAELYLAAAYYHEFSQTAQFFTATAKNRRTICEQIVDLSLAVTLKTKLSDKERILNKEHITTANQIDSLLSQVAFIKQTEVSGKALADQWEASKKRKLDNLVHMNMAFTEGKAVRIKDLKKKLIDESISTICSECGATKTPKHKHNSRYVELIEQEQRHENTYPQQIQDLLSQKNPHDFALKDFSKEIQKKTMEIESLKEVKAKQTTDLADLEVLQELTTVYRGVSIKHTIVYLEHTTNKLLTDHFDAEIKVVFSVVDADKLDVVITKDGNQCVFSQLSKGQRQLLKLCFGIAVMQAASNHSGVSFKQIFLDEAFDGLDEVLKVKAFGLLETVSLNYESVFVVEHSSELKSRFLNQYNVELINGESQICRR